MSGSSRKLRSLLRFVENHELLDLVTIGFLSLIPATWFQGDFIIKGGDSSFSLSPEISISTMSRFAWYENVGTGQPGALFIVNFPVNLKMAIERQMGLSLAVVQQLEFCLLAFVSGISMYYLTRALLKQEAHWRLASTISAIFYVANPYSITVIWPRMTSMIYAYSAAPLLLAIFLGGLNSDKPSLFFASASAFVWIFFSPFLSNPGCWITIWLLLFSILVFESLLSGRGRRNVGRGIRMFFMFVCVWVLVNLYWIMPLLASIDVIYSSGESSGVFREVLLWKSNYSTVFNVARLTGAWTIYSSYESQPYFLWGHLYVTGVLALVSVLLPILAFLPLLIRQKANVAFLSMLAVAGVFLAKGAGPPLRSLYLFAFEKIPFAGVFRDSYEKFGIMIVLPYSVLLGIGLSSLTSGIGSLPSLGRVKPGAVIRGITGAGLIALLLLVYPYPFYTGELIEKGGQTIPSGRIKVPEYYSEAAEWLNSLGGDYSIFDLPPPILAGTSAYSWPSGYFGSDPLDEYYFRYRILGLTIGSRFADSVQSSAANLLVSGAAVSGTSTVLGLLNVKYVLVHDDWNTVYSSRGPSPSSIKESLARIPGLSPLKRFGNLSFYLVESIASKVYAVQNQVIYVDDEGFDNKVDLAMMAPLLPYSAISLPVVFFASQNEISKNLLISHSDTLVIFRPLHRTDASTVEAGLRILKSEAYRILLYKPSVPIIDGGHFMVELESGHKLTRVSARSYRVSDGLYELRMQETLRLVADGYRISIRPGYPQSTLAGHIVLVSSAGDVPHSASSLEVSKVNPAHYRVAFEVGEPCFLVLSNTYDPNWTAISEGQTAMPHLVANGYANAWYVDVPGKAEIDVHFEPDELRYWGFLLSFGIFSLSMSYVVLRSVRDIRSCLLCRVRWTRRLTSYTLGRFLRKTRAPERL